MNTILNKIFVLLTVMIFITPLGVVAATGSDGSTGGNKALEINSTVAPSTSYLASEKQSMTAASNNLAATSNSLRSVRSGGFRTNAWDNDPFLSQTTEGELGQGGNVGGPIGDATFPIVLSIFFLYFLYRTVTTSKRKSDI